MRLFKDTQKSISSLFTEAKQYVDLQKRYAQKELAGRLTTLLSSIAIAAVLILLGSIVLLLLCFTLAYIIGQALGNVALGFLCMTLAALLTILVVYLNRNRWISRPLARLVKDTLDDPNDTATCDELRDEIRITRENMQSNLHTLTSPAQKPANRAELVSNWLNRGLAIYEGLRIGMSAMSVVTALLGGRRRRRR